MVMYYTFVFIVHAIILLHRLCCKLPFRGGLTDRRDIHMSIVMSGSLPPFGIRIKLSPALSSFSVVRQRCLRYTHTMPTQAAEVLETSSASRSTEYVFTGLCL